MEWLIVFLAAAFAVAVAVMLWERARSQELLATLAQEQESHRKSDHFMNGLFREMRSEGGIDGAMSVAAEFLAEECGARSAAIYELTPNGLQAKGVSGEYPLLRRGNRMQLTMAKRLLELLRRDVIRLGDGFLGTVAEGDQLEVVANAAQDSRFTEFPVQNGDCVMAAPLRCDGRLLGVACVCGNRQEPGRVFNEAQYDRLTEIEAQLATTLELMRAYVEISRRDRIDQELSFARQIQFSLLPKSFPSWNQFAVTAYTRSAKEVNGDFYDFVQIDDDRLLVVLGDACGKGVPACMLSAMTRSVIRATADNFTSLGDFLRNLNRRLYRGTDDDRFITLGCCLLDRKNSLLEFGRAGHTELLTFVRDHIRIISPAGTALGMLPDEFAEFDTFCTAFEPGMSLMLFSDGLTEALDADGEEFGMERLKHLFYNGCRSGAGGVDVINLILEEIGHYEAEQSDDQTLVVIRHT